MAAFWKAVWRRGKIALVVALGWMFQQAVGWFTGKFGDQIAGMPPVQRSFGLAMVWIDAHPEAYVIVALLAIMCWIMWLAYRDAQRRPLSVEPGFPLPPIPATAHAAEAPLTVKGEEPKSASQQPKTKPPRLVLVRTRVCMLYQAYGTFSEHPDKDGDGPYQRKNSAFGAIADFELDPALYGMVDEVETAQGRITYRRGKEVVEQVVHGCWLEITTDHASFGVGDVRSLLVVLLGSPDLISLDCIDSDVDGGNVLSWRRFPYGEYDVEVTILLKDGNYKHRATSAFTGALAVRGTDDDRKLSLTLH